LRKDNRYILALMITSGYKGFGRSGIVFPSILPRVSALKKMAVCRKFELDLGDNGLIYHVFVQPSVFFRLVSKTDGRFSLILTMGN
jgi:hypothetical protein